MLGNLLKLASEAVKVCACSSVLATLNLAVLCGLISFEVVPHQPSHSLMMLLVFKHVSSAREAVHAPVPCAVIVGNLEWFMIDVDSNGGDWKRLIKSEGLVQDKLFLELNYYGKTCL